MKDTTKSYCLLIKIKTEHKLIHRLKKNVSIRHRASSLKYKTEEIKIIYLAFYQIKKVFYIFNIIGYCCSNQQYR